MSLLSKLKHQLAVAEEEKESALAKMKRLDRDLTVSKKAEFRHRLDLEERDRSNRENSSSVEIMKEE